MNDWTPDGMLKGDFDRFMAIFDMRPSEAVLWCKFIKEMPELASRKTPADALCLRTLQAANQKLGEQAIAGPFHDTGKDDDWRFRAKLARKEQVDSDRATIAVMIMDAERALKALNETPST